MSGQIQDMFHPVQDGPGWVGAYGTITQFGGPNDKEDNGTTACGHSTIEHPNFPYCSLPIPVWKKYGLKCGMPVYFEHPMGKPKVAGVLWDKGPSAYLMRVADVSPVIMQALGGDGLLENVRVTFKP